MYSFTGFIRVDDVPSPKFQVTEDGAGVDVLVITRGFPLQIVSLAVNAGKTFPTVIAFGFMM